MSKMRERTMIKDIEKKSDEELVNLSGDQVIGTPAGTKAQQAQVEMMLRLKDSIEKLNKNTSKHNIALIALTIILLVVAMTQIVVSITLADIIWWKSLAIELSAFGIVIFFGYKIFKETTDRKE